ncbi:delta-60 repeat domain-containing protein [Pseudomonas alkylphenolica]|uniref:delta-60 repeat domain-containing protein n=1 Tax=Pseudomonas alkylphenolica TaxID=237609 RepID=UPI0018D7D568|nr:delta-60 repeat domain-containing protein [Pseudomonas alkylphenolica]MBH3430958.1 delta-60 repeat domain-containing protein [Pseudomonas alkylphenolica]
MANANSIRQGSGLIDPDYRQDVFPEFAGVTTSVLDCTGRVCVGSAYVSDNSLETHYAIFRLTNDGQLDRRFGCGGKTTGTFQDGNQSIGYHVIQRPDDGKFMVLGLTFTGLFPRKPALARFNSDGTLDTTFANQGHFVIEQPSLEPTPIFQADHGTELQLSDAGAATPQQSWQIKPIGDSFIVFGNYYGHDLVVMMFDWEANYVTSFNGCGFKYLERQGEGTVYGLALHADSQSIWVGACMQTPDFRFRDAFVVRLTRQGEYDQTFGTAGIADFPELHTLKNVLVLPEDQRIIGCGAHEDGSGLLVALRQADGALDEDFDRVAVKHDGHNIRWDHVLAVSPGAKDSKIIAAGELRVGVGNLPGVVARFNSDGSLDTFATQTFTLRRITMLAGCTLDTQGRMLVHGQTQIPERFNGYVVRLLTQQ